MTKFLLGCLLVGFIAGSVVYLIVLFLRAVLRIMRGGI